MRLRIISVFELRKSGRFSFSSSWLHAYRLPLFGLEEQRFFPIVSSGDNIVLPQIIVSHLLEKPTTAASLWILVQEGCLNNS